jgi:hypothetical protein
VRMNGSARVLQGEELELSRTSEPVVEPIHLSTPTKTDPGHDEPEDEVISPPQPEKTEEAVAPESAVAPTPELETENRVGSATNSDPSHDEPQDDAITPLLAVETSTALLEEYSLPPTPTPEPPPTEAVRPTSEFSDDLAGLAPKRSAPQPATTAEKVAALTASVCHWPCGDPQHSDFRFCGEAVTDPPYCEAHRGEAYLALPPQPVRRRRRPRPLYTSARIAWVG